MIEARATAAMAADGRDHWQFWVTPQGDDPAAPSRVGAADWLAAIAPDLIDPGDRHGIPLLWLGLLWLTGFVAGAGMGLALGVSLGVGL